MPEEIKEDVNTEDSSTTEDVTEESSTSEDVNNTEESSTTEEQPHEETVAYDRFKTANERANKAEQETAYYKGLAERPEVPIDTTDPDASLDPQTKVFYQDMNQRTQKLIDKALSEKEGQYNASIQAIASQNAKLQEKLFRQEQADVVRDSPEEMEIASMIKMGVDPDKAAWAVMGPKRVETAKTGSTQKKQIKAQQKAEANLETTTVQSGSPISTGEKLSFREDLDKKMKDAGL